MTAPSKNLLPDLDPDQYASLKESIETHGFWPEHPVVVDQHGNILDGWNRSKVANELGIVAPTITRHVESEWDGIVYAMKANTHRRHLTPASRRQLLTRLKELLDVELRRQGREAQAAAGRARVTEDVSRTATKQEGARHAAADASMTRFDEPVVAKPAAPAKVDRIGTLADTLGVHRATVARDEKILDRIEKIEKEAQRQHRDDVLRQLNKPRADYDNLERAVGLRAKIPAEEYDPTVERKGWVTTLAKCIDKLGPSITVDEADALLAATNQATSLLAGTLTKYAIVVAEAARHPK